MIMFYFLKTSKVDSPALCGRLLLALPNMNTPHPGPSPLEREGVKKRGALSSGGL
jgi:hypothetical protein